jgi:alpha-galactosidase/6-phospho-beta-glucosidase family protein
VKHHLQHDLAERPAPDSGTGRLHLWSDGSDVGEASQVEEHTNKIIKKNGLSASVYSTTDRREAVKNADYVITKFQVGGMEAYKSDYFICG